MSTLGLSTTSSAIAFPDIRPIPNNTEPATFLSFPRTIMGLHLIDIMASGLDISGMPLGNQQRLITVTHHDAFTMNWR